MIESRIQQKPPFRYISPTTDFGFKKVFGDERIMKGFLNALYGENGRFGIPPSRLQKYDVTINILAKKFFISKKNPLSLRRLTMVE